MKKDRVNIKARLNRHLRILKQNVSFESKTFRGGKISNSLAISLIFITFIFPIYPSISNIVYTNTEVDFYRGNIDESSILTSYDGVDDGVDIDGGVEHIDSYVSVNTILDDSRDLAGVNEIVNYEVRPGDSIASIASKLGVSKNTVLWANNMDYARMLKVGEIIRVPSVTGYLYKIKKGDTIERIAREYNVSVEAIEKQNGISNGYLIAGREILLPGASKKIPVVEKPKPKVNTNVAKNNNRSSSNIQKRQASSSTPKATGGGKSEYVNTGGRYKLVWRKPQHVFYSGNCTWHVARYKNVNWGGNANEWIRNARAKGHPTGNNPQLGSIIQFEGRGYNPRYGHVGIVIDVTDTHVIVSDMNYRRKGEVTVRKVSRSDPSIAGYIYVD